MSFTSLVIAEAEHGVNHWLVGLGAFVLLLVLMGCLLAFGAGRDHS
jgi:hypothetical protein